MAKYLGKLYPVHPYAEFQVIQLDVLDKELYPSIANETVREDVQYYYDLYNYAKTRFAQRHKQNGIVYYNNSTWYVDEAKNVFEFVDKMREATRKE